ncbi:MAG: hypothetical protein AB7P33_03695 [Dehalococcoidia bacterium]
MDGKKVVILLFIIVVLTGLITFSLYLLTRKDSVDDDGVVVPNAVQEYQAIANYLIV